MSTTRNWKGIATLALCAAVAFGSAACGRDDAAEDTAGGTVAEAVRVSDVTLGKTVDANMQITDETDDFAPTDRIYAVVSTTGTAASVSLTARWTFEDGQVVDETTQTITPTGPANTEFHISQANGLPTGNYKVAILLNGAEVETEEFEVKN